MTRSLHARGVRLGTLRKPQVTGYYIQLKEGNRIGLIREYSDILNSVIEETPVLTFMRLTAARKGNS